MLYHSGALHPRAYGRVLFRWRSPRRWERKSWDACTHQCSEESGCITKELDCKHEHDEACGYAPATKGTPCTFVCEICNPQDGGETEETGPEAEYICTGLCTSENVNVDCPICGAANLDLALCLGMVPTAALAADENIDSNPSAVANEMQAPTIANFSSSSSGQATAVWSSVAGVANYTVKLYKGNSIESTQTVQGSSDPDITYISCNFTITEAGAYTFGVVANGSDGTASAEGKWNNSLTFYQVTFNSNGGSDIVPQYATFGTSLTKPTPIKEGYTFDRWYKDSNLNQEWSFDDVNPDTVSTSDVTLYAKWLSTDVGVESVTVNGQSATAGENNAFSVTLPYGTEITSDTISVVPADEKATASNPQADENDNSKWTFTVTAEDGQTVENYTINVTFTPVASTLTVEPTEDTLTYGDELEIKVTPGIAAANTLTTALNTVELKKGDTVLASSNTANADGSYTLTYDTQQKGLTIGTNTLTVSFGGDSNLNASTATVDVTLSKKGVTPALDGTFSKTYDGTTNAPEGLTIKLNGVLNNDKVTATGTVAYNTDDVGTGKTITANNIELTGDDAVYYILTYQTATNNGGEITAAALSGTLAITGTAQYGQQLTASYDPVHDDEQVTYQWNRGGQPITGAISDTYTLTADDVGQSITVTATATDSNHTGSVTSTAVTVGKASGSGNSGGSSSGGSGSSYRDREYEFWMEVKEKLQDADPGDTVKANARTYDRMPWSVMEALREAEGVTLHITWNGGEDIIIPSEAALSEQSRIYYPLSYLEDMTFEVEPEAPAADPGKVNPETGSILEVTAPAVADSLTDPVTDPQRGLAETPELAEKGIEQAIPGVYEPEEAVTATPTGETGISGLLIAGIAIGLAAAAGGIWYWKRRKQA